RSIKRKCSSCVKQCHSYTDLRERASTCATHYGIKLRSLLLFLLIAPNLLAQDRKADATWLHRYVPGLREHAGSLAFGTCHYKPIFGEGDTENLILRTVTRFGEATIDAHGSCQGALSDREEEIYFVLQCTGALHTAEQ